MASYASKVNARYTEKASHYVDLKKRIDDTISVFQPTQQNIVRGMLKRACNDWIKNNSLKKQWQDLDLCESLMVPLSDILIDTTMQRMLNLAWIKTILEKFRDVQVMPVQVYRVKDDPDAPDELRNSKTILYASWDGQHTVVVLYLIAVWIFKLDPREVMVPVNVYRVKSKADIRANFLGKNTDEGTSLLDSIDIFQQMVYGVRVDNAKNTTWEDADLKQQYIEAADLFLTHEKFGDTDQPGAISRMTEIDKYTPPVIKDFAMYEATVQMLSNARPVASQEIEIMAGWFDMARRDGIEYTDEEIQDLAHHLVDLFGADFHESSDYWIRVRDAYENWWQDYYKEVDIDLRPNNSRMNKNWKYGGTFLWHQLKKTWSGRIPKLNITTTPFQPAKKDLF